MQGFIRSELFFEVQTLMVGRHIALFFVATIRFSLVRYVAYVIMIIKSWVNFLNTLWFCFVGFFIEFCTHFALYSIYKKCVQSIHHKGWKGTLYSVEVGTIELGVLSGVWVKWTTYGEGWSIALPLHEMVQQKYHGDVRVYMCSYEGGLRELVFALLLALCIIFTYRHFYSHTNIGPTYNISFKKTLTHFLSLCSVECRTYRYCN